MSTSALRRPGRPPRITRDQIVDVALDLLEQGGIEAFSVRKLAARLAVTPRGLHTYFDDRDAVLNAVAERIFGRFRPPSEDKNWELYLKDWASTLFVLLEEYPVSLSLVTMKEQVAPAWFRVWVLIPRMWKREGIGGDELIALTYQCCSTVFGLLHTSFYTTRLAALPLPEMYAGESEDAEMYAEMQKRILTLEHETVFNNGIDALIFGLRAQFSLDQ